MRRPRLKAPSVPGSAPAYYHCLSRVVDRRFIFEAAEKERFVGLMRECAAFSEVRVLTYCVMGNHFHLLVEVPARPGRLPTAEEVIGKLERLSGRPEAGTVRQRVEGYRRAGDAEGEAAYLGRFHARMWDLSAFMKALKQRFSQWYNRRAGRQGTLWEERFRSVWVEGAGEALTAMGAYIDLNPVRAGLVEDPKEYRWSGYGEAVAGGAEAVRGVERLVEIQNRGEAWMGGEALARYRVHLYVTGDESREGIDEAGRRVRVGLRREAVLEVLRKKGELSVVELLRCRVRYFCEGAVFGSRGFVEGVLEACRERSGKEGTGGAQRLRGLEEGVDLFTGRDLRGKVIQ